MVDSTLISEIKDMIKLTQEETDGIEKYRQEKEKKKVYQREWMAAKRKNDPEYYAKQKAYNAQRKKERYATDEEFSAKEREYYKKYMLEKNKYKTLYEESVAK